MRLKRQAQGRCKDYSHALRKACAIGNLIFVKIILKHKQSLDININKQSAKNGFTALDWINADKKTDELTKERIISLLISRWGGIKISSLRGTKQSREQCSEPWIASYLATTKSRLFITIEFRASD